MCRPPTNTNGKGNYDMIMQVATSASVAGSPSAMECVVAVMGLLGGLGVLLFGFKVLSESIEKLANDKLRGWFGKTSGTGRFA